MHYNKTNKCDNCKTEDLKPGKAYREYNEKGDWTGEWICNKCYSTYLKYGSYERPLKAYNVTNTCDRCGKSFCLEWHPRKEYDNKGDWTGKWICTSCYAHDWYHTDYKYRQDCTNNIIKGLANRRTGNVNPNSNQAKGDIFQVLTCIVHRVKDLNIINDNFNSPIDHSRDPIYGILQTKGAIYNSTYEMWVFDIHRESNKEFDHLIAYCASIGMKKILRVYVFPKKDIFMRTSTSISISSNHKIHWYDKFRVKEEPYNDEFQKIIKNKI